jgi:hypothetical protein
MCGVLAIGTVLSIAFTAFGSNQPQFRTQYYCGNAEILMVEDNEKKTQQVLLAKTYDPQNSLLIEVACLKEEAKLAELSPVYMKVTESAVVISDNKNFAPGALTGTGSLYGNNWDWNYLKFSMKWGPDIEIKDVNFVTEDKLIAVKKMFNQGKLLMLWGAEAANITITEFKNKRDELGCPDFN